MWGIICTLLSSSPPELLYDLFYAVYDLELVDESTFYEWKEKGKEPFGKGNAVHSLRPFFDWLGRADPESDPDIDWIGPSKLQ